MRVGDFIKREELDKEGIVHKLNYAGFETFAKGDLRYIMRPLGEEKYELMSVYDVKHPSVVFDKKRVF